MEAPPPATAAIQPEVADPPPPDASTESKLQRSRAGLSSPSKREIPRGELDEHATIELAKNPSLTYQQLATVLGCKPGTLRDKRKCPLLAATKARLKARKREFYQGDIWEERRADEE
jgi:hypothetical protein